MRIHTFDGKRYISLGDLWHFLRIEKDRAREGKAPGYINDKEGERTAAYLALNHVLPALLHDEIETTCHSADDIKKFYSDIRSEYYRGRWVVEWKTKDGETLYFRKWCDKPRDDEMVPVFTEKGKWVKVFDDHSSAACVVKLLEKEWDINDAEIKLAEIAFAPEESRRRLLKAIFGEGTEE